jgi:hypothetical protein
MKTPFYPNAYQKSEMDNNPEIEKTALEIINLISNKKMNYRQAKVVLDAVQLEIQECQLVYDISEQVQQSLTREIGIPDPTSKCGIAKSISGTVGVNENGMKIIHLDEAAV